MAASLGELFIELGVFADTKELEQFEEKVRKVHKTIKKTEKETQKATKSIGSYIKKLRGIVTAVSVVVFAIHKMTNALAQSNQEFLNLTRTSDISLGVFQKWNNIGKMLGVRNAADQIANLNQRLFELKLTGKGAEGFMLAGINPLGQDAEGIMEQLRNRVAGLDDTAAAFLLNQMGLDPTMLHLLRLSRQEFEELGRAVKQYQLTPEQVQQIQKLNIQLQLAQIRFQYLKDRAILAIMPLWTKLVGAVSRIATGFLKIVDAITSFLNKVPALKNAIIAIGAVFMAYFQPVWALCSALFLLIDDIMTFVQGGRSGIGYLLYFIDEISQKINSIMMPEWLEKFMAFFQGISGVLGKINPLMWGANLNQPDWSRLMPATSMVSNYDNRQVIMNNSISTAQTGQTVMNELSYAQNYAFNY